jgi:hypothetical protein
MRKLSILKREKERIKRETDSWENMRKFHGKYNKNDQWKKMEIDTRKE